MPNSSVSICEGRIHRDSLSRYFVIIPEVAMTAQFSSLVQYGAVAGMILIALIICSALLLINKVLGQRPRENTPKKSDIYECGVDYVGDANQQFSVRYYLIALIFLLFDVEIVFMYPWSLAFKTYVAGSSFIVWEVVLFALVLLGGYVYLRLRGALDWD
jgi:NADH-quinone oxidoreductase subunit A